MDNILSEAKKALDYEITDKTRSKDVDIDLIDNFDGKWVRGWNNCPKWLNYGLIYDGKNLPLAEKRQPYTIELLHSFNDKVFMAGYSLLKAGGKIEKHRDEEKNSKRNVWHIGLDVPEDCYLIVNDEKHKEENRKVIMFDDSRVHSAENLSDKDRLILYIKFYTN